MIIIYNMNSSQSISKTEISDKVTIELAKIWLGAINIWWNLYIKEIPWLKSYVNELLWINTDFDWWRLKSEKIWINSNDLSYLIPWNDRGINPADLQVLIK